MLLTGNLRSTTFLFFYIRCCDSRSKTLSAERLHTMFDDDDFKKTKSQALVLPVKILRRTVFKKKVPKWNLTLAVWSPADALYNNNNRWDPSWKSNISCQVYMVLLTRICVCGFGHVFKSRRCVRLQVQTSTKTVGSFASGAGNTCTHLQACTH